MYCSHCGSDNVRPDATGNGGVLYVAEEMVGCTECYDPDIELLRCDDCGGTTYRSV